MTDTSTDAINKLACDLVGRWDDAEELLDCRIAAFKAFMALVEERRVLVNALEKAKEMLIETVAFCLMVANKMNTGEIVDFPLDDFDKYREEIIARSSADKESVLGLVNKALNTVGNHKK